MGGRLPLRVDASNHDVDNETETRNIVDLSDSDAQVEVGRAGVIGPPLTGVNFGSQTLRMM